MNMVEHLAWCIWLASTHGSITGTYQGKPWPPLGCFIIEAIDASYVLYKPAQSFTLMLQTGGAGVIVDPGEELEDTALGVKVNV